jgi:bifunctional non-homologous end joining protein LigD
VVKLAPSTLVLDAELAVFDEQLRSRFEWLRHRQPPERSSPPVLIAFDLLYVRGRDVSRRPLRERRARLEEAVAGVAFVYPARRLAKNGLKV